VINVLCCAELQFSFDLFKFLLMRHHRQDTAGVRLFMKNLPFMFGSIQACIVFVDIMGYHSQRDVMFLKITLLLPKLLPSAKRVLEHGIGFQGYEVKSYQCFETNVDFDTRYLLKKTKNV